MKSHGTKEHAREQRRYPLCVFTIIATLAAYSIFTTPKAQNSGSSARLKASTRYMHYIYNGVSFREPMTPGGQLSIQTRTRFEHRKNAVPSWGTQVTKESYHILSYSCFSPVLGNHFGWKWWAGGTGRDWATHSSLSFQSFPAHQEVKAENAGRMCACQEVSKRSRAGFVQYFHCPDKEHSAFACCSYKTQAGWFWQFHIVS